MAVVAALPVRAGLITSVCGALGLSRASFHLREMMRTNPVRTPRPTHLTRAMTGTQLPARLEPPGDHRVPRLGPTATSASR